ncbi:GIN domain-containing protein [Aquimarina agarivorans]|uniref:GIN domain-containing protein n=1 Tax=Aquimarina agarivorans TaxID=980584 RepID=UPI0002DC21A8|nr:DUF2807 domain-containing protein [Aquimarina agarivorans]
MKKIILSTFLILATSLYHMCIGQGTTKIKGNKIIDTKSIEISDFRILEVEDKFEIILVQKPTPSVYIEADSNLLDYIDVKVEAEKLSIKATHIFKKFKKLTVEVGYVSDLSKIIARGRASVRSEGNIQVERLAIEAYENAVINLTTKTDRADILAKDNVRITCEISAASIGIHSNDSSKIEANIVSENLNIAQNQQSKLEIQGTTTKNTLFLLDSCNFYGTNLISKNTALTIEGKSYAYVNATDKVELKISGESEVSLLSNPLIDLLKFEDEATLKKTNKAPSSFKRLFE